jgi:antirestriction protein ArdC
MKMAKVSKQKNIYEIINERIFVLLEKGEIPWQNTGYQESRQISSPKNRTGASTHSFSSLLAIHAHIGCPSNKRREKAER